MNCLTSKTNYKYSSTTITQTINAKWSLILSIWMRSTNTWSSRLSKTMKNTTLVWISSSKIWTKLSNLSISPSCVISISRGSNTCSWDYAAQKSWKITGCLRMHSRWMQSNKWKVSRSREFRHAICARYLWRSSNSTSTNRWIWSSKTANTGSSLTDTRRYRSIAGTSSRTSEFCSTNYRPNASTLRPSTPKFKPRRDDTIYCRYFYYCCSYF